MKVELLEAATTAAGQAAQAIPQAQVQNPMAEQNWGSVPGPGYGGGGKNTGGQGLQGQYVQSYGGSTTGTPEYPTHQYPPASPSSPGSVKLDVQQQH